MTVPDPPNGRRPHTEISGPDEQPLVYHHGTPAVQMRFTPTRQSGPVQPSSDIHAGDLGH